MLNEGLSRERSGVSSRYVYIAVGRGRLPHKVIDHTHFGSRVNEFGRLILVQCRNTDSYEGRLCTRIMHYDNYLWLLLYILDGGTSLRCIKPTVCVCYDTLIEQQSPSASDSQTVSTSS